MDSGVVSGSLEVETHEEVTEDIHEEDDEIDDEDCKGLEQQFAKCREGIKLFREASLVSRSSRTPDEDDVLQDSPEKNLSELNEIIATMANTRINDQRCSLGEERKTVPEHRDLAAGQEHRLLRPTPSLESLPCRQHLHHLAATLECPPQVVITGDTCQWRIHTCHNNTSAEIPIIRTEQQETSRFQIPLYIVRILW